MTYLIDSNIFLYAHLSKLPEHQKSAEFIKQAVNENETILLTESVILSFIRLATNGRLFSPALTVGQCELVLNNLLAQPNVTIFSPLALHYSHLTQFMTKHNLTDNNTMDAHLACIALSTKATLVTNDKGFNKFPFVKTYNPLAS